MFESAKAVHFDVSPRAKLRDRDNWLKQLTLRWQLANLVAEEVPNIRCLNEDQLETIDAIVDLFNEQHAPLEFSFNVAQELVLFRMPSEAAG